MGAKDSKFAAITYEDAVKRITSAEFQRLKDTFTKYASPGGLLSQQVFSSDVLGENVPSDISELIFVACGGTSKGIALKELVCGLVLLTKGSKEEKCKFIFCLYAKDLNGIITKDDILNLVTKCDTVWRMEHLMELFRDEESVKYKDFEDWLLSRPNATPLTQWLLMDPCPITLSNDLETPTFYQTLAGVTHLEELEVVDLEKKYWQLKNLSSTGKFDVELFLRLTSPPFPYPGDKEECSLSRALFAAFDENRDGHLDFKEIVCGISAACRGPPVERMKFCFKVFDKDRDGVLSPNEVDAMAASLKLIQKENSPLDFAEGKDVLVNLLRTPSNEVDLEKFLMWAVKENGLKNLLEILYQLCHVILGLRPASPKEEGLLILTWLKREQNRGFRIGDFWYLISNHWWKQWLDYVNYQGSSSDVNSVVSRPDAIDNTPLIAGSPYKVTVLTGEGGRLKKFLERDKDYIIVPEALWRALSAWYGAHPALPRQAVQLEGSTQVELELYPLLLRLLRHSAQNQDSGGNWNGQVHSWNTITGGYGAAAIGGGYGYFPSASSPASRRYLAYTAAFSQLATVKQTYEYLCTRLRLKFDDVRLWHMKDDHCLTLLEDEEATLYSLGFRDNDQLLIEIRNKDLTWPEEMVSLSGQSGDKYRQSLPTEKGATGLNNLGNTCFMNAAVQCVSNTRALTQYFSANMHLQELNRNNPLGMKGNIAKDYGDLVRDLWKGSSRTIAPLRLRWTIGKYAPRFNGYQQHDAQELLAFLLDGLHEDLNRVHDKPYVELRDSEGRPDVVVAQEAWENHLLRNRSVVVDLFHGQLKSKVTCRVCRHESVRFDPFNYLSLPLPLESYLQCEVIVVRLNGSTPVKYGLRLSLDATYSTLKERLHTLTHIAADSLLLAEVSGAIIKSFPGSTNRVRSTSGIPLFAFELEADVDYEKLGLTNGGPEEKSQSSPRFGDPQRAVKVFQMKGGGTSPEVRRPAGFCMNVMTSMLCRKSTNQQVSIHEEPLTKRASLERAGNVEAEDKNGDLNSIASTTSGSGMASPVSTTSGCSVSPDHLIVGLGTKFLVAYHRKTLRQDLYFVSPHKTRPSLFGLPILAPLKWTVTAGETPRLMLSTTCQDLYRCVWNMVARLVSPPPPSDSQTLSNHAHDCDDSLGYEFPFTLKIVQANGIHCGICPWTKFCKGCPIPPTAEPLPSHINDSGASVNDLPLNYFIAVDWEPTALHLRYQTSLEKVFDEDKSVQEALQQQSEPVTLEQCLEAFTNEEQLSGDEKYYCPKCATHQPASKKLQIWRLPPILIVHLKRFQFVNHRWIKSHKAVDFPHEHLDVTNYLASVPRETILRHRELKTLPEVPEIVSCNEEEESHSELTNGNGVDTEDGEDVTDNATPSRDIPTAKHFTPKVNGHLPHSQYESTRKRLESTSLMTHPIKDEELCDFHQHRLQPGFHQLDIKYSLYSAVCHSGIMGGGHYVSYAKNPNGKWFYYNDSACKEATVNQVDAQTAYMLFYEREGLDMDAYMPHLGGTSSQGSENEDAEIKTNDRVSESEDDEKKNCLVM